MDHNHDDMGGSTTTKSCPMIMVFHGGHCERILWRGWVASTVTEFAFSCLALAVLSIAFEFIKFSREYLMLKSDKAKRQALCKAMESSSSGAPLAPIQEETIMERILNMGHFVQTVLYFVQMTLAYLLMLVFMNFNYWLCLSVVLGLAVGYFLFGWIRRHNVYEQQDCC